MNKQQTIYALSSQGFFKTTRPSNHPSIILANQKNVHLSYTKCNEIFQGQSKFKDPKAEQFYRTSRSLPTKNQMFKSQITCATTDANDDGTINLNEIKTNIKMKATQRRLISRSFHAGNTISKTQTKERRQDLKIQTQQPKFEYEQTKKLKFPKNLGQFQTFKSQIFSEQKNYGTSIKKPLKTFSNLYQCARNLEASYHLDQSREKTIIVDQQIQQSNLLKTKQEVYNPQSPIKTQEKLQNSNKIKSQSTFTIKLNNIIQTKYVFDQNDQLQQKSIQNLVPTQKNLFNQARSKQVSQINKLRLQLAKKQRELRQTKLAFQNSEKKNKTLEMHIKKLQTVSQASSNLKQPLKIYTYSPYNNYNNHQKYATQIKQQLGGSVNALLYFTLFVILLAKQMSQN